MPTNTATPSTMPAVVSSVRRTCLRKYGQLISRSRIRIHRGATSSTTRPSRSAIVRSQLSRDVHVVRHDDDRRAEPRVQVANQREDLLAGARVEVAGRLVGEQDRRIDRQRAGDRDALPLAARQLVGQMLQPVSELHERQQLARALVDLLARPAAQVQRQADVLEARQRRQQVEELEDEADLVAPDARQRHRRRGRRALRRRCAPRRRSAGRGRRPG